MNVVVVEGRLSGAAQERVLRSGRRVVGFELAVDGETVPIAWENGPNWAADLVAGDAVVVLGRVRRRFFRVGGATQSRTEVVAERIVVAGQRRRVRALLDRAAAALAK
jgi:single-strand DNA-binding protein